MFGWKTYEQELPTAYSDEYPEWNPGEEVCPLQPSNAIALAVSAATNSVENSKLAEHPEQSLSLLTDSGKWFYQVELSLTPFRNKARGGNVAILVGIDGKVPPIREISNEELTAEREKTQENLRQYQMEVIRAGMAPLPIPLSQEMDDQLVKEGILPPSGTSRNSPHRRFGSGFRRAMPESQKSKEPRELTPAQKMQKHDEVQRALQLRQMQLIREDKPLLPVRLTKAQKTTLEKEGILFLADGSISNTATGFCHPPRSGIVPE